MTLNLTKREREVITMLSQDLIQKEVAARLRISIPTVKQHLLAARQKNKCRTTVGLVLAMLQEPATTSPTWNEAGLGEGHA